MGHTILSKYQQKLILTEPQRRETLTSSYVSPLALSSTRKALINASLVSFSKKSSEASASDSDKSTRFISDSINCTPTTRRIQKPNFKDNETNKTTPNPYLIERRYWWS
jgi:hypothetical protein